MPRRHAERPRHQPRRDADLRRRPPTRQGRSLILIVCEGAETEFRYFEAMRRQQGLLSVSIEVVSVGRQSERLVAYAVDRRWRHAQEPDGLPYEEVWCVFDREAAHEPEGFPTAILQADRERIGLAVSNPCFEYWYLLHYRATNRPFQHADEVCEALRAPECLPGYQKNQDVFDRLAPLLQAAIERADRLYERHPDRPHDRFPNPSTLVQRLISRLLEP